MTEQPEGLILPKPLTEAENEKTKELLLTHSRKELALMVILLRRLRVAPDA